MRRQLSDLDAKRRQMTAAEHERRRYPETTRHEY
jgi:hypothetical protein